MYSVATLAALLSAAALASAQGRFPCSYSLNGAIVQDGTMCYNDVIAGNNPYYPTDPSSLGQVDNPDYGLKIYGYAPINSQCIQDYVSGNYYCGYTGAPCSQAGPAAGANTNCDNGSCSAAGVCTGAVGSGCTLDSDCLGYIYCKDLNFDETQSAVCGGVNSPIYTEQQGTSGATCDDGTLSGGSVAGSADPAALQAELDNLCISNFCATDYNTALWPKTSDGTILATEGECAVEQLAPSIKARARRADVSARGSRCPASHTACSVPGSARGFECVDTTSNLEQCGGCAGAGGVDCTALPGVDAVGCVAGSCEIWACAEGFAWDASSASCTVALVA